MPVKKSMPSPPMKAKSFDRIWMRCVAAPPSDAVV